MDINYFNPRDQGIKPLHLHMTRLSIILFYIIAATAAINLVLAGGGNSSCEESSTAPRASASPSRFEEDSAIPPEEKKCEEDDEVSSIMGNITPIMRSLTPSPQSRSSVSFEQRPFVTPSIGGADESPETTQPPVFDKTQFEAKRANLKEYYKKKNRKERQSKSSNNKEGRDRFPRSTPTPTNAKTISAAANDALRENLIFIQRILLFTAAVTFIGILVYSVYYINLIRNVYAKERESE